MLHVRRNARIRVLLAHGEDDIAECAPSLTDEELTRIGERADRDAFSTWHANREDAEQDSFDITVDRGARVLSFGSGILGEACRSGSRYDACGDIRPIT